MKRKHWYTLAGFAAAAAATAAIYTRSRASAKSAPYEVLDKDGDFELRDYPDLAVARAIGTGEDFDPAFRRLFRFISRGNSRGAKISMTTPVLIDRGADDVAMDFVMPVDEVVPQPLDGSVMLGRREGGRVAALRFGGFMSEKRERRATAQLREMLAARGLRAGDAVIAYYDAPAVPPPLRRNEVLIRIE